MIRYLLGFFGALVLEALLLLGLIWVALENWLFSSSPLWFDLLFWFGMAIPFPMTGDLVSRRAAPAPGWAVLLPAATSLALTGLLLSWGHDVAVALMPLAFPVLYHLGWLWGQN